MKIYFKTFGCRINQIETESIYEKALRYGIDRVNNLEECDFSFINSCSVTENADRDVLNFIKKANSLNKKVIVSGCLATLWPQKILDVDKNAIIIPNNEKSKALEIAFSLKTEDNFFSVNGFYGHTRAFVKIQEGCDLKCSYCVVSKARPDISSKDSSEVLKEIKTLINSKFKEITLCGTRLGYYKCPKKGYRLKDLISEIFSLNGEFRIRLSSIEPMELNTDLLEILKKGGDKFCDHFHISIQHFSDNVLKAMRRPYKTSQVINSIKEIRKLFPDSGIFADIITAFPSETEEDFIINKKHITEMKLSGIHSFTYSKRPMTEAASMKQLSQSIKICRSKEMRSLDLELRNSFLKSMLNKRLNVLILKTNSDFASAISSNFINVLIKNEGLKKNIFVKPLITSVMGKNLFGLIDLT